MVTVSESYVTGFLNYLPLQEEMQKAAFQALQLQKDSMHGFIRSQVGVSALPMGRGGLHTGCNIIYERIVTSLRLLGGTVTLKGRHMDHAHPATSPGKGGVGWGRGRSHSLHLHTLLISSHWCLFVFCSPDPVSWSLRLLISCLLDFLPFNTVKGLREACISGYWP